VGRVLWQSCFVDLFEAQQHLKQEALLLYQIFAPSLDLLWLVSVVLYPNRALFQPNAMLIPKAPSALGFRADRIDPQLDPTPCSKSRRDVGKRHDHLVFWACKRHHENTEAKRF